MSHSGHRQADGDDASVSSALRDASLRAGAVAGVVAYAATYAVTFVLASLDPGLRAFERGVPWSRVDIVGWLFYGAHLVPLEGIEEPRNAAVPPRQNPLESIYITSPDLILRGNAIYTTQELVVPAAVYIALPVLGLAIAGYLLAAAAAERPAGGAASGAAVVVGYLPVMVLGTYAFAVRSVMGSTETLVMPDPALAAIAGAVLPIVVGGAGGYLAARRGASGR